MLPHLALGIFAAALARAEPPSIEALTRPILIQDVQISPGGNYLALRTFRKQEEKHALHFLDRETMRQVGGFTMSDRSEVGREFYWVNDERVVGEVWQVPLTGEQPKFYGELFGTNADGSRGSMLFGYRTGQAHIHTRIFTEKSDRAWGEIIDVLPDDRRHILISVTNWTQSRSDVPEVRRLDVYSARDKRIEVPTQWSGASYLTDSHGDVRLITGVDESLGKHVKMLPPGGNWVEMRPDDHGKAFTPLAISEDGASAYAFDNRDGDHVGLYRLTLDGKSIEKVYEHDSVDITEAITDADGETVYALRVDDGYPSYLIFSDRSQEAKVFRELLAVFPGRLVSVTSSSRDDRFWVVTTSSDVNESTVYLFDREKKSLGELFTSRPDVPPDQLAPMRPVQFPSFDGRTISGYFTPALNAGDGPAPLVVLVHGGPVARDYWGYRGDVQVLATRGYSVLQVNYRGSSGYGREFERLGRRQWGNDVQKDIIAGTRWAIAQGMAETGRVCIMGASFGAYSAVQSATLAPDLFACVIANAGIYDLGMLYSRGDVRQYYFGEAYLDEQIGHDDAELARYSPVNRVEVLRAPVLIAHGGADERAPVAHARRLKRALDEHHKPYEWFVKAREAHGFYNNDNQVEYLRRVLAFLRELLS